MNVPCPDALRVQRWKLNRNEEFFLMFLFHIQLFLFIVVWSNTLLRLCLITQLTLVTGFLSPEVLITESCTLQIHCFYSYNVYSRCWTVHHGHMIMHLVFQVWKYLDCSQWINYCLDTNKTSVVPVASQWLW